MPITAPAIRAKVNSPPTVTGISMVHSVPLADALADVGFLRSLLNRLPSINTPQKHDKAHMRDKGGDSRLKRASAGRMLMLGTDDQAIPGNRKPRRAVKLDGAQFWMLPNP